MADEVTLAVLQQLNAAHELSCGTRRLMFNLDFDTDVVTLRGPSSTDHVVRFDEVRLCDYVNGLGVPVSEEIVLKVLCDMYARPERYGCVKSRS